MKIVIDHLAGSRAGERQEFEPQTKVRFGRHPENEVSFDPHRDLDASTRHAELRYEEGHHVLVDVGSSNGTFCNGQKVTAEPIPPGTPVEIDFGEGGPKIRIFVGDPAQLPAPIPMTMIGGKRKPAPPATIVGGKAPHPPGAGATAEVGPDGQKKPLTVSVMVTRAREHAASEPKKGGFNKTTVFMKTMVDQALHQSSKRFKLLIAALSVVFLTAIAGMVWWIVTVSRTSEAQAKQTVVDLEKVVKNEGQAGPRIVHENRENLYLLAYTNETGEDKAFCTSFAVAPHFLATNAHCVEAYGKFSAKKLKVFVVRNGAPKVRFDIKRVRHHPDYNTNKISPDVGLFEVDGTLPSLVKLADRKRLEQLETGANMFTYGFPGRLALPSNPEATLTAGTIGRITDLEQKLGPFDDNILIQHSAYTMEGTSGSPVFDAAGYVIAVNAGSYVFGREKVIAGTGDQATKKDFVKMSETLAGYNYGFRIDRLVDLLREEGAAPKDTP